MLPSNMQYVVLTFIFLHVQVKAECPQYCNCSLEEKIDCSNTSMTVFPVGDWKLMNMSHNAIGGLKMNDLRNNFLEIIDISNNIIEYIDSSAFMGNLRLKEINISWNNITHICPKTFLLTPNLESLSLANNRLLTLQDGLKFRANSLKILDISYCNISRISKTTMKYGLSNLQELYLQHNKIEHISRNSFSSLKSLKILNIGYNYLQSFEVEMFVPLIALTEIRLENNPVMCNSHLKNVTFWCFTHNIKLENLTCVCPEMNRTLNWSTHSDIIKCNDKLGNRSVDAKGERDGGEESDSSDSEGLSPVTVAVIVVICVVLIVLVCTCLFSKSHDCCGAIGWGLICLECLK